MIFVVINAIIVIQFLLDNYANRMFHIKRYMGTVKIVLDARFNSLNKEEINNKLKIRELKLSEYSLEFLKGNAKEEILDEETPIIFYTYKNKRYILLKPPNPPKRLRPPKRLNSLQLPDYIYKKDIERFFKHRLDSRSRYILLTDLSNTNKIKYFWIIVLFVIDVLLAWFYYFIYRKLKPLLKLKDEITKFSNGNLNIDTKVKGKDEIAQVSNEFNNAIEKIKSLNDSRKLFLRNVLHELKTPITKGKLISDTLDDSKKKRVLQRAFLRLEFLLEEFVKVEELTSGKINLEKKEYRVIDLLDQALDLLLIDKSKVDIYPNVTKVFVDFDIFSIALKNLIDNAIKYNTNGNAEIIVREDSLIIKNKGEPLKKTFDEYLKPFNREYESIDKGLGLGLYITSSIINSHGFKLYYYYSANYHILKIQFILHEEV